MLQVKQEGQLTSDDYEMVDYMLNQFKTVIGVNGNSKKKEKNGDEQNKDALAEKGKKQIKGDGQDFEKCVGYEYQLCRKYPWIKGQKLCSFSVQ